MNEQKRAQSKQLARKQYNKKKEEHNMKQAIQKAIVVYIVKYT